MTLKSWSLVSSEKNNSCRIFDLRTDKARSPRTQEVHEFYVLESRDWVNVIPLTPDDRIVLIRQYRHGTREITLEIPGGIIEQGDTPEEAARRELREETGYGESEMISLESVRPNPAFLDNRCYTFVAKNVFRTGEQLLDDKEDIEILLRPITEVPALIREGQIAHSLVLAAFYRFYMEFLPGQSGPGKR